MVVGLGSEVRPDDGVLLVQLDASPLPLSLQTPIEASRGRIATTLVHSRAERMNARPDPGSTRPDPGSRRGCVTGTFDGLEPITDSEAGAPEEGIVE